MGCDIHSWAEVKKDGKWVRIFDEPFTDYGDSRTSEPFGWRSYGMFAFLADVRNYSHVPVLAEPRGLPDDSEWLNSAWEYAYENNPMSGELIPYEERETNKRNLEDNPNWHTFSWITLRELVDFDYRQKFENRRQSKTIITGNGTVVDGRAEAAPGCGVQISFRDFLGKGFFECVLQLSMLGRPDDVRIVFYFDN